MPCIDCELMYHPLQARSPKENSSNFLFHFSQQSIVWLWKQIGMLHQSNLPQSLVARHLLQQWLTLTTFFVNRCHEW